MCLLLVIGQTTNDDVVSCLLTSYNIIHHLWMRILPLIRLLMRWLTLFLKFRFLKNTYWRLYREHVYIWVDMRVGLLRLSVHFEKYRMIKMWVIGYSGDPFSSVTLLSQITTKYKSWHFIFVKIIPFQKLGHLNIYFVSTESCICLQKKLGHPQQIVHTWLGYDSW